MWKFAELEDWFRIALSAKRIHDIHEGKINDNASVKSVPAARIR